MTSFETTTSGRASATACLFPRENCTGSPPHSLGQAIEVAARAVEESKLGGAGQGEGSLWQPRALLALLTYCYTRQTYGSVEVAAWVRQETALRQFCGGEIPDVATLRRFRRQNRQALQFCLKAALRFVAEQKVAEGVVTRVSDARLEEEARRRIIMAMFTDSMELDKDQTSGVLTETRYLFAHPREQGH